MEKQWHARRQNNPGRQKNPAARKPDFNCSIFLIDKIIYCFKEYIILVNHLKYSLINDLTAKRTHIRNLDPEHFVAQLLVTELPYKEFLNIIDPRGHSN